MIHMYSDVGLGVITVIHEFDLNKISAICLPFFIYCSRVF